MAVLNITAYPFQLTNTLQHKMLNFANLGNNNNKYYEIMLQQGIGPYEFRIFTKYGRINSSTKEEGRFFTNLYDAQAEFNKILKSKIRKGYVEIELTNILQTVTVQKPNNNTANKSKKLNDNKVLNLISNLYTITTSYVAKSIDTPLGKLSANQIAKGAKILDQIDAILKGNATGNINLLTNQFYAYIPQSFGRHPDLAKLRIDTFEKIVAKRDLLDVIASVVQVNNVLESEIEKKYHALGIQLRALDPMESEFIRINKKIQDTHGKTHHFKMRVKDIFEVQSMANVPPFNPYNVKTMELFHGTRKENVLGIMQKGILIKPNATVHTGSMFGAGAYFADCSTKSAQYTDNFTNHKHIDQYFFLCDVAVGKIKEVSTAQTKLRAAPRGYNSVKGCKGKQLQYNEYIVYNSNQVKIRYIVVFEKLNLYE